MAIKCETTELYDRMRGLSLSTTTQSDRIRDLEGIHIYRAHWVAGKALSQLVA